MTSVGQQLVHDSPSPAGPAPRDPPSEEETPEHGRPAQHQSGDYELRGSFTAHSDLSDDGDMGFAPFDLTRSNSEEPREELTAARIAKRKSNEFAEAVDKYDNPSKAREQIRNKQWLSDDVIDSMNRRIIQLAKSQTTSEAVDRFIMMNPCCIKFDQTTLAPPPRSMHSGNGTMAMIPLHYDEPSQHWTLAKIDIDNRLVQWYNPLPMRHTLMKPDVLPPGLSLTANHLPLSKL